MQACLFPPILYDCPQHWQLNIHTQRCGPGSKRVANALFPGLPFCSFDKGISALADKGSHAGGQWQWSAEEQWHPPSAPLSPHTPQCSGATALPRTHKRWATCSCTLAMQPGLTPALVAIRSGGTLSLRGFPRQGGKHAQAPTGRHQVYIMWMHICPYCCFASCLLTAIVPINMSLCEFVTFSKEQIWSLSSGFCEKGQK